MTQLAVIHLLAGSNWSQIHFQLWRKWSLSTFGFVITICPATRIPASVRSSPDSYTAFYPAGIEAFLCWFMEVLSLWDKG